MAIFGGLGVGVLTAGTLALSAFDILGRIKDSRAQRTAGLLQQQQAFQTFDALERRTDRLNQETDIRRSLAQLAPVDADRMVQRMELRQIIGQNGLQAMQRARVTAQPTVGDTLRGLGML